MFSPVLQTRPCLWGIPELSDGEDDIGGDYIKVPPQISTALRDWLDGSSENHLYLWGWDDSYWLETAVPKMAYSLAVAAKETVIVLDCGVIGNSETEFLVKFQEALSHCLASETPISYAVGQGKLSPDALREFDGRLESTIVLFITCLDKLPDSELGPESQILQCIRVLLQSTHFRVLLTGDDEVELGDHLPNVIHKSITGCWATSELMMSNI